jgi:hypothetical protein
VRTMVLIKRGANAPRYQGLPLNKAFSIERGFMQHTFQVRRPFLVSLPLTAQN